MIELYKSISVLANVASSHYVSNYSQTNRIILGNKF